MNNKILGGVALVVLPLLYWFWTYTRCDVCVPNWTAITVIIICVVIGLVLANSGYSDDRKKDYTD